MPECAKVHLGVHQISSSSYSTLGIRLQK